MSRIIGIRSRFNLHLDRNRTSMGTCGHEELRVTGTNGNHLLSQPGC